MASKLAASLIAALLLGLSDSASADMGAIDIFTIAGVPDTGGYSSISGPCYCIEKAFTSPVMLLEPGTYDFGEVRAYWVQAGPTPDDEPDQPFMYFLFDPQERSGTYPDAFPVDFFTFPSTVFCNQDDDACNANYRSAYVDTNLIYTMLPGQNAAQVQLIGNFQYTAPLPEPFAFAMFILGLTLIAGIAAKRGHADQTLEASR